MAEPDGKTVPRWGPYPLEIPERARIRRYCEINYSLVSVHTGDFAICPSLGGHLGIGYDKITITAYPRDDSDYNNKNDQARHDMLYSYGDPHKWTPLLTGTGYGLVDNPHKFEMRIKERDFRS